MFKPQEKKEDVVKEAETIIGPSVRVKGDFNSQGNIIIEGILEGNLNTSGNVFIGDKAKIVANIKAQEARIGGEIVGNIKIIGCLRMVPSARLTGDIECSTLIIEQGAIFNGKCIMTHPIKGKE